MARLTGNFNRQKWQLRPVSRKLLTRDPKPHLIFEEDRWCLFRNAWKSQFSSAAAITGPTIPELKVRLAKAHDGWKFGSNHLRR